MNTRAKLDRLARLRAARDESIQSYLIQKQLIDREIESRTYGINAEIDELEKQIKNETLEMKQSIESDELIAIYNSGRTTLDAQFIKTFYEGVYRESVKQGEPYVTIQKRKDNREKV